MKFIIICFSLFLKLTCIDLHAVSYTPMGEYSEEIISALEVLPPYIKADNVSRLNLQNKPFLFASDDYIFDYKVAKEVIDKIVKYFPNLTILDLSINRLPENALPSFLPLLEKEKFQFLDIRINAGANSLGGIYILSEAINNAQPRIEREQEIKIFTKIIWLSEDFMDRVQIPEIYKNSHRQYYHLLKEGSILPTFLDDWSLPS